MTLYQIDYLTDHRRTRFIWRKNPSPRETVAGGTPQEHEKIARGEYRSHVGTRTVDC
jgi:hypothetical protein